MNQKDNNTNLNKWKAPFKVDFSLRPLINFWKKLESGGQLIDDEYAAKVNEALKKAPELLNPIEDMSVIEKHRPLVNSLMGVVISPASYEYDYYAAIHPDNGECFYETPAFKKLNLFTDKKTLPALLVDTNTMHACTVIGSYTAILSMFYNIHINYEFPLIYPFRDEKTGLDRHFRIRMLSWFMDAKKIGSVKPISEEDKKILFENLTNLNLLKEFVPSDKFEFTGFMLFNAVDITDQQIISSMKYDLMEKDSISHENKVNTLQQKFRSLLRKPDLRLGIAALDEQDKNRLELGCKTGKSFVLNDTSSDKFSSFEGSLYERLLANREIIIVNDLAEYSDSTSIEKHILNQGIRNLLLAPLKLNEEVVGILELGSPNPGDLNKVNTLKMNEILPMFAMCVKSTLEDMNKSIQAIIKEKCTAIHPSVEWRFRNAASDYLRKGKDDAHDEMEEIVFDNVYPLYGLSDIRDSSRYRNAAIQADLIDNLNMAKDVI
ncbi:MAG: GAF domain-containing protein, partial [Ignavibacteria bacterium]